MAAIDPNSVDAAFAMLLDEIERLVHSINATGAEAFQQGRRCEVEQLHAQAKAVEEFQQRITALRKEWDVMSSKLSAATREPPPKTKLERLKKGMRAPEEAYYIPILRSLEEMGGSGKTADVCDAVYRKMKDVLKPLDFEPLPSSPRELRWRNAAKWARHGMVKKGLLSDDSPRGIWEITDKGREYLRRNG